MCLMCNKVLRHCPCALYVFANFEHSCYSFIFLVASGKTWDTGSYALKVGRKWLGFEWKRLLGLSCRCRHQGGSQHYSAKGNFWHTQQMVGVQHLCYVKWNYDTHMHWYQNSFCAVCFSFQIFLHCRAHSSDLDLWGGVNFIRIDENMNKLFSLKWHSNGYLFSHLKAFPIKTIITCVMFLFFSIFWHYAIIFIFE